jgi:ribonuclease BN (tRNA processing enzyme)
MRLTVIGCSGSFPGPESPASCYLLEAEGFRLLLDLGNGALGALQQHAGLYDIDAVCLSHLHGDHYVDLCSYYVARHHHPDGPKPPIPVYGPAGTAERMARAYGLDPGAGMTTSFGFEKLTPGMREIGPFGVTVDHVNHPVETFGFRVTHGGWTLAYSADTGECDALVELARDVDLLLCEASFLEGPDLPVDVHLTALQAARHAARAGVGQLVLTHLVPWNDQQRTLAEASGAYRGPMSLATSGLVLGPGNPAPGA